MDDKEYCDHNIIEMRNYLSNMLHSHICDHDISDLSAEEVGEVTDMIKDLAATERYSAQACYYKTVTKAMKEAEHPYRMGYIPDMDDYPPRYNRMNPRYPEYIYIAMKRGMTIRILSILSLSTNIERLVSILLRLIPILIDR